MKSERYALLLSAIAALVIGAAGLLFALLTHSQAILLDGLFNLSYFVTAVFTLRVAQLVARPDDEQYPFGYGYFEPLINLVKGLLILGISLLALHDALIALFTGGREIVIGPAIGYAVSTTLVCITVAFLLHRAHRSTNSPLVRADLENWAVNGAISAAVLLAFCVIPLMSAPPWMRFIPYVDPLLVTVVILISLSIPVRMAWRALAALLNRAPAAHVREPVISNIKTALAKVSTNHIYVRMIQPGRTLYVAVHVLLPEAASLSIQDMDTLRHHIVAAVAKTHANLVVDVVFTADEQYAAPTAGFCVI